MRIFLRKLLSKFLQKDTLKKLKVFEYTLKKQVVKKLPKLDEDSIRHILLNKLGIKEGDHVFIHASMDMLNTDLSPLQLVDIFLNLVGPKGSISVPTFIRYSSEEWMNMDKKFDIKKTPTGMGILSERVRRNKKAKRSLHPTKSVACIGEIAGEILSEHHLDKYAFGVKSPFVKLLDYDVKVIGFGVPMSYLSMVHTVEDCFPNEFPLQVNKSKLFEKACVMEDKSEVSVSTFVHDLSVIAKANPEKFVKKYLKKTEYKIHNYFLSPFFVVYGKPLFDSLTIQMKNNNTIYN